MNHETPLTEVAAHLPTDAAGYLLTVPIAIQEAVLKQVRAIVVFWEEQSYTFDPVTYEAILRGLVPSFGTLYTQLFDLQQRNTGADLLIRTMSDTITELTKGAT